MEATLLRFLLLLYAGVVFIIAISYLYYRRVTVGEYLFWGVVALLLPVIGPFFVIAARPGPRRRARRQSFSHK